MNRKKISLLAISIFAFLVFLPVSIRQAKAIDESKDYKNRAGILLQVNEGHEYSAVKDIKIDFDSSVNSQVEMFSVVICQNSTSICTKVDASHRYKVDDKGKKTITASLDWITSEHKSAVISTGEYTVKVKPEYKKLLVKDIFEDEDKEKRYIESTFTYHPFSNEDIRISYNGVNLDSRESTVVSAPVFTITASNISDMYGAEVKSISYKYCMAGFDWKITSKCQSGNLTVNGETADVDLSSANLEGNYQITAFVTDATTTYQKSVLFQYDVLAPRVTIAPVSQEIAKSHTISINVVDNNNINVKYSIQPDYVEEVKTTTIFKNNVTDTTITVDSLTGKFRIWIYAVDTTNNATLVSSNVFTLDNTAPKITKASYLYDSLNKEAIVHVEELIDQCNEGLKYYYSLDKATYTESVSNNFRVLVTEETDKIYLYVTDKLGNVDEENVYELSVEVNSKTSLINFENETRNHYFNENVTFLVPNSVTSITINGTEYISNAKYCTLSGEIYKCEVSADGVYSVKVITDETTDVASFIINKSGKYTIDGVDKDVSSIVMIPVVYEEGKYYGSLPLHIYDIKNNVSLIHKDPNSDNYLSLSSKTNELSIADIKDCNRFELDIDVALYQYSMYSADLEIYYYLGVVTESSRSDNDIKIINPTFEEEIADPTLYEPGEVKYINEFDWREVITLKNVIIVLIIVVIAVYLIRFFLFRKK